MISLVYLASHLILCIANTNSQCSNSHSQSLLLSISINGNQIDKIGSSNYLSIVESSANSIVPAGTTRVGINTFGGRIGDPTTTATKLSLGPTTWSTVQSTIQRLSSEDFDANWGNSVTGAVQKALTTAWYGQRYHIVFSSGMPLANGFEEDTNPINFDDPCSSSITAKQNNIQQYVVLIGVEGVHYIKEYFSCMVQDPEHDIIEIDPSFAAAGIAKLHSRVCKTNGIDVQITEVNPIDSVFRPFIEVLNRGAPASISVCWDTNACSTPGIVDTGAYYVGYGSGNGTIPTASGTIRGSLGINIHGAIGWTATAQVDGFDATNVTHGSDLYWQALIPGNSYELRGVGYNNGYGGNWRMSCYPNQGGTPGYSPVDCQELDSSCRQTNCDLNGAESISCAGVTSTRSLCHCPHTYLEDIHACIRIPAVKEECKAFVIWDEVTQKEFTYFTWNRVEWDGDVSYEVLYPTLSGTAYWNAGGVAAASRNDAHPGIRTGSVSADIHIIAKYRSPIRGITASSGVEVTCDVETLAPVIHPTLSPTLLPTQTPTTDPTPAPTFDAPGVFLYGVCGAPRCECFDYPRTCCVPFGPSENPQTLTSGVVPNSGCHNVFKTIEIEPNHQTYGLTESITLEKYGDTAKTEVRYTMRAYGVMDRTAFENLTQWTDYYGATNELQTTSTLEFGNKLNIQVTPPGNNEESSGIIVIGDGEKYGELVLDISVSRLNESLRSYQECKSEGLAYQLIVDSCTSVGYTECDGLYPHTLWIMVYRSDQLCRIGCEQYPKLCGFPVEDALPSYLVWVLIALFVFSICLAWLVYRFWWKQKKTTDAVAGAQDELAEQIADNNAGFYKDLDAGDMIFNGLATGVPGVTAPSDPFGNELHQRKQQQQNEMAHVEAETVIVRQSYAPVTTKPKKEPKDP